MHISHVSKVSAIGSMGHFVDPAKENASRYSSPPETNPAHPGRTTTTTTTNLARPTAPQEAHPATPHTRAHAYGTQMSHFGDPLVPMIVFSRQVPCELRALYFCSLVSRPTTHYDQTRPDQTRPVAPLCCPAVLPRCVAPLLDQTTEASRSPKLDSLTN